MSDGANGEACTGYIQGTLVAMRESIDVVMKARGILLPGAEPYGRMAEYYMNVTTPAGTLYNWGPGSRNNVRSLVLEAGETLKNPYLIYFGSNGERGTEPPYQSRLYPVGKTFTMRTSWTDENGLGAFINARVGGPHSCPDDLNLDIYAYGRYLLADPGPGSYNPQDPSGQWQSGTTIAHNTIVIDGGGQARSGNSEIWTAVNPVFDYVGCWTDSYMKHKVYRRVLFVRPSYWIVSDYIKPGPGAHTYDQAWHPDLDSNPVIDEKTQRIATRFAGTANVQLVPADPGEVQGGICDGWMEGRQAKYVTFRKSDVTGAATFDTVIYPTRAGDKTVVSVERLAVKGPGGELARTNATALKIAIGKDRTGYYFQSYLEKPAAIEFGGFSFDGETAYVELDAKGTVTYAALRNGASLKRAGKTLVEVAGPVETLGVRVEGDTLRIESAAGAMDVTVACTADVKKVLLNGENTPFTRKDGVLRILTSGGIAGFTLDGADVKGTVLDGAQRLVHVYLPPGTAVGSLTPKLEIAEGYTVTGVKEADAAEAKPYKAGLAVNFAKPAQFILKAGSVEEPLVWTVAVRPMGRVAIVAFDKSGHKFAAGPWSNTERLYKILTGWNAAGDWLEWKIEIPEAGAYVAAFMYASGHSGPARDLAVDGEVKLAELRFPGTGDWGAKETGWRDIVFAEGEGIALQKGTHTLRMTNLNGEGMHLGWIALIPVEELPLALDPKVKGRLAADYLQALEAEFTLRNQPAKK